MRRKKFVRRTKKRATELLRKLGYPVIVLAVGGWLLHKAPFGFPEFPVVSVLVGLLALTGIARVGWIAHQYMHHKDEEFETARSSEIGFWGVTIIYIALVISGYRESLLWPMSFLVVAVTSTVLNPKSARIALATAMLWALLAAFGQHGWKQAVGVTAIQWAYLFLFGSLRFLLRRFEVGVEGKKAKEQLQRILGDIEAEAKSLRQNGLSQPGGDVREKDRKQTLSSYFEIHEALQDVLHLLAVSLETHTAAVLLYRESDKSLKLIDACSSSKALHPDPFPASECVLHAVISSQNPLRTEVKDMLPRQLGYYKRAEAVTRLMAVPVMDKDRLLGLIVADRLEDEPFDETSLDAAKVAAGLTRRILTNENHLRGLEKSREEYYRLAEASKSLAKTLSLQDVVETAVKVLRDIAPFDFAAVVMLKPIEQHYEICLAWPLQSGLTGVSFGAQDNNLVDWVVRRGQLLVYHDFKDLPKRPSIFSREEKLGPIESLLIAPLQVKAQTHGALVLAASQPAFFTEELQHIYQIIANQIAVSYENARTFAQLEGMAITDGLTGLYNKLHFQERIDEIFSRAERHETPFALVVCDLDHFKQINDTYGHPVGDLVLREVGRLFRESMRKIDLVARYGGEEFVIILDSSGEEAAMKKAEEIREAVKEITFGTELGEFSVTMSFGIAVFPQDARNKDELIGKADSALYRSKKSGRNRVTPFREL